MESGKPGSFILYSMKNHYTYILRGEDGRYYYGARSCDCPPLEDVYLGSYRDKTFKPKRKRILSVWDSREAAIEEEIRIHNLKDVAANPRYANRAKQTSTKFDTSGVSLDAEIKVKMSEGSKRAWDNRPDRREERRQFFSEWNKSEDHKSRIRGELNPMHRLDVKERLREANLGERNPHYGKPTSLKQKEASSKRFKGMPKPESQRAKMSASARGRKPINNGERRSWLKAGEELQPGWKFGWDLG
jgi:hypothetical protein